MKLWDLVTKLKSGGGGVTYETPSYAHALGSGDRRVALLDNITTSGASPMWGLINTNKEYGIDGVIGIGWRYTNNAVAVANEWLEVDFTGQASPTYKMDKFRIHFNTTLPAGTVFKSMLYIGGSWVDASANFNLAASATQEITQTVTDGLTKWRLVGVSGNSSWDVEWYELEFSIGGEA